MNFFKAVLLIFSLFFTSLSFAQQDSLTIKYDDTDLVEQQITEENIASYKEDSSFNYIEIETEESFIGRFKQWIKNILTEIFEYIFGVGNVSGILYFIFNIIPYLILAVLIVLLLKFFLNVNSRNIISGKQNQAIIQFTEDEHIIKNKDIIVLINEAIAQRDFRLAIRYYYLLSLKYLAEKNIISWQQQKTNEDYISEIKKGTLKKDFKAITRIYDYVWYGEFNIDELRFNTLKSSFETLNATINQSE
ncbi:MAG: DUF4129 domain-containing protein [Bacteroidetes bacterium]|nr:DUF4129 domain-containing protein [Bacteroidota bacterium]